MVVGMTTNSTSDNLDGTPIPTTLRLGAIAELARDLRELHDDTGISLDAWVSAREVVEAYTGPVTPNGA
jgi:hypothetical protein